MDHAVIDSEFMRPLVTAWLGKLDAAARGRSQWKEVADECAMFYNSSARAMWDPKFSKKFWQGGNLPRYRVTINKAFEMVAIFGPNLFWEVPHRTVEAKRSIEIPQELFGSDEQGQEFYRVLSSGQAASEAKDKVVAFLMDRWLNYTPREQPGGGLAGHSQRAVIDALITGRGALAIRPYKMPGSGRNLTGAFRVSPYDVLLDPDFDSVDECRWMAIKHVDVHSEVEQRFGLPKNSLRNKATLESTWQQSEYATDPQSSAYRKDGRTNDLVVWYEIYSKSGLGIESTAIDPTIRDHMSSVAGQYAYLAVCADVPYPLNMPAEKIRKGATDDEVRRTFEWPIPVWADDRWPVEFLDFYTDPQSAWPVAPLAPGLGELKLLNHLVCWFTGRIWSSGRDFWAVAAPQLEHFKEHILNGDDLSIIPVPPGNKSIKEYVEILTQPETRQDLSRLIEFVSDMFDRRVGLTPTIYGQNEGGTQSRTAEETVSKQRMVMARPEYMSKQVVDWQSRAAQSEAFVTRWFVTAEDVRPFIGDAGAYLWGQHIQSSDIEFVTRQFQYTVAASSIRRPNRDRDITNYQQVMGQFAPVLASYGQASNDYGPFNGMMGEWARLHDTDLSTLEIPVPDPPSPEEQAQQDAIQQQSQMLELGKVKAEIDKLMAETQAKLADAQAKPLELQSEQAIATIQLQIEQIRQQGEANKQQSEVMRDQIAIQMEAAKSAQEQRQDAQRHTQDIIQDEQSHQQKLRHQQEQAEVKLESQKEAARVALAAKKAQASATPTTTKPAAKPAGNSQ